MNRFKISEKVRKKHIQPHMPWGEETKKKRKGKSFAKHKKHK